MIDLTEAANSEKLDAIRELNFRIEQKLFAGSKA